MDKLKTGMVKMHLSIKYKIFLIFFSIFLLFALCVMYFVQSIMTGELEEKMTELNMQNTELVIKDIDNYLEQMRSVYYNILTDKELWIEIEAIDEKQKYNRYNYTLNKLRTLTSSYKSIYSIYLYDINDNVFISSDQGIEILLCDDWIGEAQKDNGRIKLTYIRDNNQPINTLMAYTGTMKKDLFEKDIAYVSVNALGEYMKQMVYPENLSENTLQFVLDHQDNVVFGDDIDDFNFIIGNITGKIGSFENTYNGIEYLLIYGVSQDNNWKYIQMLPKKEVFSPVIKVRNVVYIIFVVFILIGMICSYLTAKLFSGPINKLVKIMEEYRKNEGDLQVVKAQRGDEFRYLYESFNNMVYRVDRLIDEVYKANLYKKELELRNIHESINPHFIYNVLDSIIWIMRLKKYKKGITLLETFSTYLRNILHRNREFVSIRETEQELITYCELQKFFFNDIINYEINFSEEIKDYAIMTLLLQPVIENIYIHAFKNLKKPGEIKIMGSLEGEKIVFRIKDNGIGMSRDKIMKIKKNMKEFKIEEDSRYFGLGSVYQRIRLVYGEECGVDISSEPGKGTLVTIVIPAKEKIDRGI
ncbi:MAG: histidine kinase [Firmicutes bacterium]|nr:histidine kinase [Bacillota bacterium]